MMNLKWKKKICQMVSRSAFRRTVEHQGPEVFQKPVTDFDRYQQARARAARERKKDLLAFEKRVMWGPEEI